MKIEKCPFCGGEADIEEIPGSPFTNETYMWAVGCKDCNIGWYEETKAEAIAAWNRRVDVAPVVRGEWVVTDAYPHRVYCSLCYKTNVPNEEWLFEKNDYPKYCMWCGAKMEVEHETD